MTDKEISNTESSRNLEDQFKESQLQLNYLNQVVSNQNQGVFQTNLLNELALQRATLNEILVLMNKTFNNIGKILLELTEKK
jgi:hypothetical protein